jgi:antitoxin (DNA-binding transcriptional repressor) of toxin-antitoxin stability system
MDAMAKDAIHISDKEAARDFASLLGRVREGAEVVIENDARRVAVICRAEASRSRLLSKSDNPAFGSPRLHLMYGKRVRSWQLA